MLCALKRQLIEQPDVCCAFALLLLYSTDFRSPLPSLLTLFYLISHPNPLIYPPSIEFHGACIQAPPSVESRVVSVHLPDQQHTPTCVPIHSVLLSLHRHPQHSSIANVTVELQQGGKC